MVYAGLAQPLDENGKPICVSCPTRLSRCKGTLHGPAGRKKCQRCVNRKVETSLTTTLVMPSAPATPRKRARSDPGEQPRRTLAPRSQAATRRVTPAQPPLTQDTQRTTRQDDKITRLLDETHARRMAAAGLV